ncbi:MAG: glycosyltransferase [Phycisphaeraceae bacterium]|nr:glycosyltransferase [Phycisphaeraceae bacterium]MCW5761708.1 glycosyltransferase [Phycisphaeraceae bacterium]
MTSSLASIPLPTAIVLMILTLGSIGLLVYWSVALVHAAGTLAGLPTAGSALGRESPARHRVCMIVPAHNEASNIGALVASMRAQNDASARFVLALDRCTDDTESIARAAIGDDDRFEIVLIDSCPPEWAGKVHAAWSGASRSRAAADADLLVFSDADCSFHPECLRACAVLLDERRLDMLSLLSTLSTRHWFEKVAQPAATLELMRQYPLLRANHEGDRQRPFANGQFMMFRASAYREIGGHEAVREALLEDIAFARLLARAGLRTGLLLAGEAMSCRMYDTWGQFREGWKRIYIEAANRKSRRLVHASLVARSTGTALPLCGVLCLAMGLGIDGGWDPLRVAAIAFAGAGLLVWLAALLVAAKAGRSPLWAIVCHPIGSWLVGGILARAGKELARGVPTRWGGRQYVLKDRSQT